jgi:hypothetical protein
LIGTSTGGIILSDSIKKKGMGVIVFRSDDVHFDANVIENIATENSFHAGAGFVRERVTDGTQFSRQGFLFFTDTQLNNYSQFLSGMQSLLGNAFSIIGGGSTHETRIRPSFQFYQNNILTQAAVGVLISGHTHIAASSHHGWRPLGKPRFIDRVEDHIIKTIDGRRASFIYEEFFGPQAEQILSGQLHNAGLMYPLGISVEGTNHYLIKNVVNVLPDGSLVCQGTIPVGARVHIMIGNKDSCKQAALDAAVDVQKELGGREPKLILILESVTRLKLLGRMAFQEIKKIKEIFGPHVPIIGLYTNGEFCPFQMNERYKSTLLQNESIVIIGLS